MPSKWTPSEREHLKAVLSRRRSEIMTRKMARRFARNQAKKFPGRSKEDIFRQLNHADASDEILELREIRHADEVRAAKESPNENDWEVPHNFSAPRVIGKVAVYHPNGPGWACGRIVVDMFEKIRLAHSDAGGGSGSGVTPMSQTGIGRVYSHILNRTVSAIRSRFGAIAIAIAQGEPIRAGQGIDIWRDFAASRLLDRLLAKRVLPFEKLVDGWLFIENELALAEFKVTPELADAWIDFAVERETVCGGSSLLLVGIVREWIERALSGDAPDIVDLDLVDPVGAEGDAEGDAEGESASEVPIDCDLDTEAHDSDWKPDSDSRCVSSDDLVSDSPSSKAPSAPASPACSASRADEYIGDQLDRAERSQTVYEDMVDSTRPEPERDPPNPEPSAADKFKDFEDRIASAHAKIGDLEKADVIRQAELDKANGAKLAKKTRIDRLDHAVFGSPDESAGLVVQTKEIVDELIDVNAALTVHVVPEHIATLINRKVEEALHARDQVWFRKNMLETLTSLTRDSNIMDLARGRNDISF